MKVNMQLPLVVFYGAMIRKTECRLCFLFYSSFPNPLEYLQLLRIDGGCAFVNYMEVPLLILLCHCIDMKTCLELNNNFIVLCLL